MHIITQLGGIFGGDLYHFESLPSTNQWALGNLATLHHGDVIVTTHQTRGYGRFAREWISPPGQCLTLTILLQNLAEEWHPLLTRATAVAVYQMLTRHGLSPSLKWPNDVLTGGRKICGILAEASDSFIALGLGINVNLSLKDLEGSSLERTATSMRIETRMEQDPEIVQLEILNTMSAILQLPPAEAQTRIAETWRTHDALAGRRIQVQSQDKAQEGLYIQMDSQGRLCLQTDSGDVLTFWAGDTTILQSRLA